MDHTKSYKRYGSVSYKLEFPQTTNPIFCVSCLKKVIGKNIPTQTVLPELDEEGRIILDPECILQTHMKKLMHRNLTQYIIQWKNLPVKKATWEDEEFIQKNSHLVIIEDNASFKRGAFYTLNIVVYRAMNSQLVAILILN